VPPKSRNVGGYDSLQRALGGHLDVRFGSKADILLGLRDVRFTPESGHCRATVGCPLCAKSGREQVQQTSSICQKLSVTVRI
jgi:hypothetical protein